MKPKTYEGHKRLSSLMILLGMMLGGAAYLSSPLGGYETYILGFGLFIAAYGALTSISLSQRLALARQRSRVFFIYARQDVDKAKELAAFLRDRGFRPWLDIEEISPGQIWKQVVVRSLEESASALVLISKNFEGSEFAKEELKVALERLQVWDKNLSPVIPVRLDETEVPEGLAAIQWIKLDDKRGLEKLAEGLHLISMSSRRPPLKYPAPPRDWRDTPPDGS